MTEQLCVVATIAGQRVAVAASDVNSVVDLGTLTPVPGADPAVRGLAALRSQVVTVIDPGHRLGKAGTAVDRRALVTKVGGHEYAVMVEDCTDIAPLATTPLPAGLALAPQWRAVTHGLAQCDDTPVLLIALAALIPAGAIA